MIRIGRISYANLYPIFYCLERQYRDSYIFVEGVPTRLNKLIKEGGIDISPSSSIEYLRHSELYRLVPGHSVSSVGEVKSIILFSHHPIEKLNDRLIYYTYQSGTSVLMLDVILRKFFGIKYRGLKESRLSLDEALTEADAYLLIGDDALKGVKENHLYYTYDLGQIWHEHTGLPFVYALWIARKELREDQFNDFVNALNEARDYAEGHIREIADSYSDKGFMSTEELIQYWRGLSYDLTERHLEGLSLFKRYLEELGWLK